MSVSRWIYAGILFLLAPCLLASSLVLAGPPQTQKASMTGFSPASAIHQRAIEEKFKSIPSPDAARRWHRTFTAEPHPAGSDRNNELARYIADQWKQQGWEDVVIHQYDVLNSNPREVSVEMVAPTRYRASLKEDAYDVDPDTKNPRVRTGYLSMSASGEVTGPLVYAHSGNPEDYALLKKHGIDVKGKIVLVRYSNPYSYRGFKALTAQREGAAAMLVYSDPAEDGFKKGKVFPEGPWGPESHIQRGAITYDFIVPGDPLTPGWASLDGAKRIPVAEAQSVPKIIAVAMSWRDAKPLLENLGGPEAPKDWQGGLPVKYRLGGSAVKVHVKADMDTRVLPNYVVEARIRGSELPDEWVVLGNHRDAWEFGGVDPSSGTASMMELSRAFAELKRQGLRPRRTIVVCSWDGEEVGLTGSTEWGEQFADELKKKGVAYLNVDSSVSGPNFNTTLSASGAPLIVEVSKSLEDPSGKLLYDAWKQSATQTRQSILGARAASTSDETLPNTRIGSGSDYTVFLNYVGIPVFDLSFDGPYGVYHSQYDNHYWMSHFGDPEFKYHALMSQVWGVLALRLANAEVLPFDFAAYASNIRQYTGDIQRAGKTGSHLDLRPLLRRIAEMQDAGRALHLTVAQHLVTSGLSTGQAASLNLQIREVEQNFLNPAGLPGRPWFKHILYACRYTYAHLELPGLADAVEAGDWTQAKEQAAIIEAALARNNALLRSARGNLLTSSGTAKRSRRPQ